LKHPRRLMNMTGLFLSRVLMSQNSDKKQTKVLDK
jgi:hypothetical protein